MLYLWSFFVLHYYKHLLISSWKRYYGFFSILQYIAYGEYVFPYFFNTDSFYLEKGGFCSFFKLYNNFIGYSGTFYVPVTIKTNFISKYKYSVCLFHFSSLCIVYKYYELYIVLQRPRKRRAPLSAYHPKRTDWISAQQIRATGCCLQKYT